MSYSPFRAVACVALLSLTLNCAAAAATDGPATARDASAKTEKDAAAAAPDALPAGALARLGDTRCWQNVPPQALRFGRNSKELYAVYAGKLITWDCASGWPTNSVDLASGGRPLPAASIAVLNADRTRLLCGAHTALTLWNLEKKESICPIAAPAPPGTRACVFLPHDEILLFSGDCGLTWLDAHGKLLREERGWAGQAVRTYALSGDGRRLAFSRQATAARREEQPVVVIDTVTGKAQAEMKLKLAQPNTAAILALNQDGTRLAAGDLSTGTLKILEVATGKVLVAGEPAKNRPAAMAFSPDGKWLACHNTGEGKIRLFHVAETLTEAEVLDCASGQYSVMSFSDDSGLLAYVGAGQRIVLWDLKTGKPRFESAGHRGPVRQVRYSSCGKWIGTGSADKTAILWDAATRQLVHRTPAAKFTVESLDFSPDGQSLAVALGAENAVRVYAVADGRELLALGDRGNHYSRLAFLSPQRLGCITLGNTAQSGFVVWSLPEGKVQTQVSGGLRATAAAFSRDGEWLASSMWLQAGRPEPALIDLRKTGHGEPVAPLDPAAQGVLALEFAPCGKFLAVAGVRRHEPRRDTRGTTYTDTIRVELYELCSGKAVTGFDTNWARCLAFSPDGRMIASGEERGGGVQVHCARSGKLLHKYPSHADRVDSVAFSPDGRELASAGGDGTVLVWDATLARAALSQGPVADEAAVKAHFDELAAAPERAYRALWALRDVGAPALELLARQTTDDDEPDRCETLLVQLQSPRFAERMKAAEELGEIVETCRERLMQAHEETDDADLRFHLQKLLARPATLVVQRAETLRDCRIIWLCAQIGGPRAEQILQSLSKSASGRVAAEARSALSRLQAAAVDD